MSLKDRLAQKQQVALPQMRKGLKERLAEKQTLQPKPVKPNTDFVVGMQNIGRDLGNVVTGLKDNLPAIGEQIVQSATDNLNALKTPEGVASTASALARGAVTGAVDLFPGLAGLGADIINSYAGTDVISKENNWHRPMAYAQEQLANKVEMQKNLAIPVIQGAEDNYKYTGPQPSVATQYIVGADPNAQNTQFAQGLGNFIPDLMAGGAIAGARKVANAGKVAKLVEANKARMLADTQKAKYARQIEKLAQAKAEQAVAKNKYIDMAKDNTIAGSVIGATEGENLEERGTNAVLGGLMGAGGTAIHAGGAKALKSKSVADVTNVVKNATDDFINSHHNVANVVGTTSRMLNQNPTSELAGKYQKLDELLAQNTTVSKNLTKAQEEIVKIAQGMSDEDSVNLHDALNKGDVERAKDIIRKNRYDINDRIKKGEKVSDKELKKQNEAEFDVLDEDLKKNQKPQHVEDDLSHVKDEIGTNTPKQEETPLKTQSDMSGKTSRDLSAEELYYLLKDDGFVEELVHVNDITRLGLGKEKPLNDKVTKLPSGEAETMPLNERTKGAENIYENYQKQEFEDILKRQYQEQEAYSDGFDNVNDKYIGEGFHEEKIDAGESFSKKIIPDGATPQEVARGVEFMKFYNRFKKHGYDARKQRRLYENHISKMSNEDKLWTMEMMAEQADTDIRSTRVRNSKATNEDYSKQKEAIDAENNAIKNISNTEINAKREFNFDRKNVEEGNKVLVNSARKQLSFHFNKSAKASGMNFFKAQQAKTNLIKNVSDKTVDSDIAKLLKEANNKQEIYDALIKDAQGIKNETTRKYVVDKVNKAIADVEGIKKTSVVETTDKVRYNKDFDALEQAVKTKDVETINKVLSSHSHKLHKAYGLNQQQQDIIADAYSVKANDFIERLNNYKQTAKNLFEAQGENKRKPLVRYEAETLSRLKEEYAKLKGIIKNSFTDFTERERFEANRETGKLEATGDSWDRKSSGVNRQRFEDVLSDIESAFNKAVPEQAINKYKVDGEVDTKKVREDLAKINDDSNLKVDKDIVELMSSKLDSNEYTHLKNIIEKQSKGLQLTDEDFNAIKSYKAKAKEYVGKNVEGAYGGLLSWKNKLNKKTETMVSAKAQDVAKKGADVVSKAKEVADGFEHKFVSKLAETKGQCKNVIKAIKTFADSKQHNGVIPDEIKNFVEKEYGSKVKTTYTAQDVLSDFKDSHPVLKEIIEYIDPNEKFYLVDDNFRTKDNFGSTSYSGDYVFVKFKEDSQFIGSTAHELLHKFVRQNILKGKYDLVKRLTGITQKDIEANNEATKTYNSFKKTEDGKVFLKYCNSTDEVLNSLDVKTLEKIKKGVKLYKDVESTKEETLAYEIGNKIRELYNERYGKNTDRRHTRMGRTGRWYQNDVSGTSEGTRGRELPENIRTIVGKIKQVAQENGVDEREAVRRLSNEDKLSLHEYYSNNNKTIVKNDVDTSINVVEEIDNNYSLSKILKHVENIKTDHKKVQSFIEDLSKQNEKTLIEYGALTESRAKGALKKQHEAGEGVYYQSYGRSKHKDKYIEFKNRQRGLFGFKKMDGKSNERKAIDTVEATIKRSLDINRAKQIVDYVRENFAEPVKRGVSHDSNYIPVNTNLLFTAIFQRKTPKWYETISGGKKAIKEAFGDDADALKELTELFENNSKADAYIPKEVYRKLFDGTGENPAEYFANYIKSNKNIASKDGAIFLLKSAGVMTDIVNSQFKKTVLTTGSFFTNNRLGNQIMLMAKAGNLGDYVKGIVEAVKMKDNAPVEILESTLMEACEEIGSTRQPSGWEALDTFANLLEGNRINTDELTGLKKVGANVANKCLGLPNEVWVNFTEKMMKLNEKAERFERKQAYSQAVTKAKKDKVIGTAQKAMAINEFHKYLKDNPELKGYIIKKTEDILGDYNNFTNVEKKLFKRIVPFYSWHRTIFRHTINLAKENPTRASLIALKLYLMNNRDDGREDWQRGAINNILGIKLPKGYVINKKHVIPYATIKEDLGGSNPVNSVTPALKVPSEIIKGKKSFAPASEIQDPNWKRVTKTVGKGANRHKVTGYFNKKTGEFVKGTPWQVRAGYAKKEAMKVAFPMADNAIFRGWPQAVANGRFPDKMYDTNFSGFYDGDYIGRFNGKKKYRSAKNELPLGMQLANRIAGVGFQKDTKDRKLARKQELYKNRKRRNK